MMLLRRAALMIVFVCAWLFLSSSGLNHVVQDGFNQRSYCTGDFAGCAPEGDGGDAIQNVLKNRDIAPQAYSTIPLKQLIETKREKALLMGKRHRKNWTSDANEEVAVIECSGWVIDGYLIAVKQQASESCNCHDKHLRDYHLWLGTSKQATEAESLIAEVTPRLGRKHSGWKLRILERLAQDHAHVRISGWGMWDGEHPNLIGKTRATLIEIHPIMKIEVQNGGVWLEL